MISCIFFDELDLLSLSIVINLIVPLFLLLGFIFCYVISHNDLINLKFSGVLF